MPAASRTRLELRLGPLAEADLLVRRAVGREALSAPYHFDVDIEPRAGDPLELADLVAQEARLAIRRPDGAERLVHGLVERAELLGLFGGRPRYQVRLVPRLALLGRAQASRIFQEQGAVEVVEAVLGEARVALRLALGGSPAKRPYCVQYRETTLDFVRRLLEEEGIFTSFEHVDGQHTLVLSDDVGRCPAIDGDSSLPFREAGLASEAGVDEEHVSELARRDAVAVDRVMLRDFDFERPDLDLGTARTEGRSGIEWYEHPGRYLDAGEGKRRAGLRIEEARGGVESWEGRSDCLRLRPGATFEVAGAPDPSPSGRLVLVEVEHEVRQLEAAGEAGAVEHAYRNRFLARPADPPYRPPRRTGRPRLRGVQTAIVVGPGGEEIHLDAHGRIKVRFHWDRLGPGDDGASCWLRLGQGWAGAGFGASVVPRVGQEVVVGFLDGDPDRPMALGAVYDGDHAPPLALPGEKTRSTQRTDSSKGGGGQNELRLEDAAGAEEILLHAQRDQRVAVEADKRQEIRNAEAHEVGQDRTLHVKGAQRLAVTLVDAAMVKGNRGLTVAGQRGVAMAAGHTEQVAGDDAVLVGGTQAVTVMAASVEAVGAAAALTVGGVYAVTVAGLLNVAVGGLSASQVGGDRLAWVKGSGDERVEQDATTRCGGDAVTDAKRAVSQTAASDQSEEVGGEAGVEVKGEVGWMAQAFTLEATDSLSFMVGGQTLLTMKENGDVTFGAKDVTVEGDDVVLKGSKVQTAAAGSADSGSAQVARLEVLRNPRASVQVAVADQAGQPLVNEPFRVELPDGSVVEGVTDGKGRAAIPGAKEGDAKVTFTRLDGRLVKKG
jgi:type VI secretion system secreted protein VgrG